MKVLMVSGEFPPMVGGVGDYTACLASALHDLGVQVSVVTSAQSRPSEGAFSFPVIARVPDWNFRSWGSIRRNVERHAPDIVHIQYQAAAYRLHPAANLLPIVLRVARAGVRSVVTFHDLKVPFIFPKAGPLRERAVRLMARSSDGVICTDEADLATVSHWGLRPPAHLIPIGSNIPVAQTGERTVSASDPDAQQTLQIGYFGLLNSSKGIDVLLRGYRIVRQRGLSVTLTMIGANLGDSDPTNVAYARRIKGQISELDIDGSVRWTGQLSPEDTSRALQSLDACVLPYEDGASFRRGTLMAALAHGLPIITTRPSRRPAGEASRCLSDRENCLLVPPGDVGALAEAIQELANSPSLRERLARGARDLSKQFTWERIARKTLDAYERVLCAERPASPGEPVR